MQTHLTRHWTDDRKVDLISCCLERRIGHGLVECLAQDRDAVLGDVLRRHVGRRVGDADLQLRILAARLDLGLCRRPGKRETAP